ncbi:MAG: SpoVG family protein [Bacillota bacterium]
MEITDVRIYPVKGEGKVQAYVSLTLEDQLVIRGMRVVEGKNGLFVAMPSRQWKGEFYDICFPLTSELRDEIHDKVLGKFEKELKNAG